MNGEVRHWSRDPWAKAFVTVFVIFVLVVTYYVFWCACRGPVVVCEDTRADTAGMGQDTAGMGQDTAGMGQDTAGMGQDSAGMGRDAMALTRSTARRCYVVYR